MELESREAYRDEADAILHSQRAQECHRKGVLQSRRGATETFRLNGSLGITDASLWAERAAPLPSNPLQLSF